MVGDIAIMEPGEIIPVDGIFVSGHNVKCDESGATGESDAIKKFPFEDVYKEWQEKDGKTKKDCFILSGSKVLEGVGSYVVVAIGERSFNGRILLGMSPTSYIDAANRVQPFASPWPLLLSKRSSTISPSLLPKLAVYAVSSCLRPS